MMHYARIAQRAFNTPLMVEPSKALAFLSGLGPRIAGQEITFHGADLTEAEIARTILPAHASLIGGGIAEDQRNNDTQPFSLIDGIALIEITGTLVHRGAWIGQSSGITSYEGIAAQIDAAIADPAVRGIALEIDSFGGEVAGAFDLADRIRVAREAKPVHAFVATVLRSVEDNLLGESMTSVHALVSSEFFDKLISHSKTADAYKFFAATGAQPLREDMRRAFPFAGILFEEYNGSVTLSTGATERLIPAGEGIAFPMGTFDTFTTYGGPANARRASAGKAEMR